MNKADIGAEKYSFTPSIELLRELKGLSPREKLDWLEEANEFISRFLKPEDIERWRRFADR